MLNFQFKNSSFATTPRGWLHAPNHEYFAKFLRSEQHVAIIIAMAYTLNSIEMISEKNSNYKSALIMAMLDNNTNATQVN